MLMALALYPIERFLFFFRNIRGFRRADHILTNKILTKHRVLFLCKVQGERIILLSNPSDDLFALLREGKIESWEPGSLEIWKNICSRSAVVVDIGAYSGIYSLLASKVGVPVVWSVEPNPNSAKRLRMNKKINQASNLRVLSNPLSNQSDEELGLFVPQSKSEINGSRLESSGARFIKSDLPEIQIDDFTWKKICTAKTMTLDDFNLHSLDQKRIGGIKIDAEGMELSILRGAHQILSEHKPDLIIETWSDISTNDLNEYLNAYGYKSGIPMNDTNYNVAATNLYFTTDRDEVGK
jgi:FkbM family methyltransferase